MGLNNENYLSRNIPKFMLIPALRISLLPLHILQIVLLTTKYFDWLQIAFQFVNIFSVIQNLAGQKIKRSYKVLDRDKRA